MYREREKALKERLRLARIQGRKTFGVYISLQTQRRIEQSRNRLKGVRNEA